MHFMNGSILVMENNVTLRSAVKNEWVDLSRHNIHTTSDIHMFVLPFTTKYLN